MALPIDIIPLKNAAIELMAAVEGLENDQGYLPELSPAIKITVPIHKVWLTGLKAEKSLQGAKITYLGDHWFRIELAAITCTGADVLTRFNIPYGFQLGRLELKHTDSSFADSSDALTYSFDKKTWNNLYFTYLNVVASTATDIVHAFDNYYFALGEFLFTSNTTNTDIIYPSVLIKMMEV